MIIFWPPAATIAGKVWDGTMDNVTAPGAVTVSWSKCSGLGPVTLGDRNAPSAEAPFSVLGLWQGRFRTGLWDPLLILVNRNEILQRT